MKKIDKVKELLKRELEAGPAPLGQWETDWDCLCEHCIQCEGDYCTIYWRKTNEE